jgi:myosin heavy subunit
VERRPVGAEYHGRRKRSRARNHENSRQEVDFQASDTGGSDSNLAKRDEARPNDSLKTMCKEYRGLKTEYSSLEFESPFTLAQAVVASKCVIDAYKALSLKVQDLEYSITLKDKDYKSLKRSQITLQKKLDSEVEGRAEQITQLTTESAKKEGRIEQLNQECERRDGQMRELRTEHQTEKWTIIKNGNAQIHCLQDEAKALKTEHTFAIKDLEDQHEQNLKTHAETVRQNFAQSLKDLQDALAEKKQAHTNTVKNYEERLEKLKRDHAMENSNLEARNKRELLNQKRVADRVLQTATEEWTKELQNKQTELDGINAVHEERMRRSNEEWERRLQSKQTKLDDVETAHIHALQTVNEGWEKRLQNKQTELNGVISSYNDRIKKLLDSQEVRLANHNPGLRATNEQLKNALVERDHFKVISDREVANIFQDISVYVEEFAGEPWEKSLGDTWPFPSAAFEGLENDRRTRTHLIQNTLWVILYEMIFCTPFRVLGEEGEKMDMQWLEKYNQG